MSGHEALLGPPPWPLAVTSYQVKTRPWGARPLTGVKVLSVPPETARPSLGGVVKGHPQLTLGAGVAS